MSRNATSSVHAPMVSFPSSQERWDASSSDDEVLRKALADQNQLALAQAYRRYGQKVYRTAFGVLRRSELAEDVTQEVFVRLWQRPDRFDSERGTLAGFLQLDAHGRSVDLLRSEMARTDREIREQRLAAASDSPASIEEQVMKRISSERVQQVLALLRPEERDPIALAFFQGHSYQRVAAILDLPEGTIKSRIRKGLGRLRQLLGEEAPALV